MFGPFGARALIEVSTEVAKRLVDAGEIAPCGRGVIDAIDRDLDALRARDASLAESALALAARSLAIELENPYHSLTSKSMATKELREDMDRLRELAPASQEADSVDELRERRSRRLARRAGA